MIRILAFAAALIAVGQTAAAQSTTAPQQSPQVAPVQEAPLATQPPKQEPAPVVVPAPTPPPPAAPAPKPAAPPPSPRGKLYTWGSVGTTFAYGETYANANLGAGYLLRSGITPNVEASYMFGNSPTVWALRPGVTWFLPTRMLQPYVGAYYTHWFVGGNADDQDGVGGRAGFSLGRVISLGVTYDRALGCDTDCDMWTPQISAGFSM